MIADRYIDNLSRLLWDDEMIGTRFTLAMSEFAWAATLIFWGAAHNLFDRPTYRYMDMLGSEYGWGAVFLLSGILQITIVLRNDLHSAFAQYFAGCNATLWIISIGGCYLSVYPPPAAMSGELALTLAACWIWVRPWILKRGLSHE